MGEDASSSGKAPRRDSCSGKTPALLWTLVAGLVGASVRLRVLVFVLLGILSGPWTVAARRRSLIGLNLVLLLCRRCRLLWTRGRLLRRVVLALVLHRPGAER